MRWFLRFKPLLCNSLWYNAIFCDPAHFQGFWTQNVSFWIQDGRRGGGILLPGNKMADRKSFSQL